VLSCLGSDGSSLPGHGLEAVLDGGHGAARATGLALEKEDSGVLLEEGVGGATGVAGHVLLDVPTQDVLDLLLLKTTLDDQLVVPVNGTTRPQLRQQKVQQMLLGTMEPVA